MKPDLKYFVFVLTPREPGSLDTGFDFSVRLRAGSRAQATRTMERYFSNMIITYISEAPVVDSAKTDDSAKTNDPPEPVTGAPI